MKRVAERLRISRLTRARGSGEKQLGAHLIQGQVTAAPESQIGLEINGPVTRRAVSGQARDQGGRNLGSGLVRSL